MPTLYYRVEAPGKNILDIVTQQVVAGLLDELDLTKIFTNAVYILQPFSAYSQYDDGNGAPSLIKDRCDIEVNYILDKAQVPWPVETPYTTTAYGMRSTQKGRHSPVLVDKQASICIEHHTVACGIEMAFDLTFQTYDDATKAFDTIKAKYAGSLVQTPFDLAFSYPVSMSLYSYLYSVYKAKTAYQTKTFMDYINDHKVSQISFDVRKSQLDQPDADRELMVRVQQLGCLMQLTIDQKEPDALREGQLPDSFKLTFNVVFQFGRPDLIAVHTPVSVDNTVLPYNFFEKSQQKFHYNPLVEGIYQDAIIGDLMAKYAGDLNWSNQVLRLPAYDDWFYVDREYIAFQYRPVLIAHFTLDGPTTTIDLKQLDDIQLHPIVQDILKQTGRSSLDYGGIFNLSVWAGELRLDSTLLTLSEDLVLTISSTRPDKVYHLMLSETTNLQQLDPTWDRLLLRYRYFFPLTIERNVDYLIEKNFFYVGYDYSLITLITRLWAKQQLRPLLSRLVDLGEDTNALFSYTQTPTQLADYLVYTKSLRSDYQAPLHEIPTLDNAGHPVLDSAGNPVLVPNIAAAGVLEFYDRYASPDGRSLLIAFLEQCVIEGYISPDDGPAQYLRPSKILYPNGQTLGGSNGFNTPVRVFQYHISA